jgi:hypothetical protein
VRIAALAAGVSFLPREGFSITLFSPEASPFLHRLKAAANPLFANLVQQISASFSVLMCLIY